MLTVRDVMTTPPVTVTEDTTLLAAAERLAATGCADLMVVGADDTWLGVCSEGDIVRKIVPAYAELGTTPLVQAQGLTEARIRQLGQQTVRSLLIRETLVLHPADTLLRAACIMASMQIRRLPVVENGRLLGTLARAELVVHAARRLGQP